VALQQQAKVGWQAATACHPHQEDVMGFMEFIALVILLWYPYHKLDQIHEELKKFNGRMS
jgi:hypothetical protein